VRLYLIRHGKARRHSHTGRDADRELDPRGREQAEWLAAKLRHAPVPPQGILTSPAARALQTANLLAAGLGLAAEVDDLLGLSTTPSAVVELLGSLGSGSGWHGSPSRWVASVALVGHNPTLSIVAGVLCHGPAGGGGFELRTGQAAVLELADLAHPVGTATLVEMLRVPGD